MKPAVLGGTGRTGTLVLDIALARGHHVAALTRSPDALPSRPALVTVTADARDQEVQDRPVDGADEVISTLGHAAATTACRLRPATRRSPP